VRIHSVPDHGTTVSILLPVAPSGAAQAAVRVTPDLPQETQRVEHVLLVEDDAGVRATCRKALGRMGLVVHEASDGPSALKVAGTLDRIDLVITDVIMPGGMSGPDLASAIRSRRPEVPIVFMSGYHADILATESLREDFHLLSKPFTIAELQRAVQRVLPRPAAK
jgi:CheY-like chemotaxis protein